MMSRFKNSLIFNLLNAILINSLLLNLFVESAYAFQNKSFSSNTKNIFPAIYDNSVEFEEVDIPKTVEKSSNQRKVNFASLMSVAGAGQTESNSFSINSNDDIVNKFTGDLNYKIPVMDVDGFPLVLTYNPNITMDQEASWVGLGWDLPLGSINREMRGVPDDFAGDVITREFKTKKQEIKGLPGSNDPYNGRKIGTSLGVGTGASILGSGVGPNLTLTLQVLKGRYYNTYTGKGSTLDLNFGPSVSFFGFGVSSNLGYSIDNQNGIGISSGVSFNGVFNAFGISFGGNQKGFQNSFNTRDGIMSSLNYSTKATGASTVQGGNMNYSTKGSYTTYGKQTYIPRYSFNSLTIGDENEAWLGTTLIGFGGFARLKFIIDKYHNSSEFKSNSNQLRVNISNAYGYLNLGKSTNDPFALLDFNRDASNETSTLAKNLNFSHPTFDLFYCNAPGISTNFRANRYELLNFYDPKVENISNINNSSEGAAGRLGIFNLFGAQFAVIGAEYEHSEGLITGSSRTEKGIQEGVFVPIKEEETYNKKEYYLSTIGEMTPNKSNILSQLNGEDPSFLNIQVQNNTIVATGELKSQNNTVTLSADVIDFNKKDNIVHYREFTGKILNELNVQQGVYKILTGDDHTFNNIAPFDNIEYINENKKEHHIQALEVINEGGIKYSFGIANYNYSEENVLFSVKHPIDGSQKEGITQYESNDNSVLNNKGRQNIFDKQIVPAYAHSFLLTGIFSNDYVDLTNDGPSKDDIGNYYTINYCKIRRNAPFGWRFPLSPGSGTESEQDFRKKQKLAFYQENLETDPFDDLAHYQHGRKDMYYGHSIETKNMIAFFVLEERKDLNSYDDNGTIDDGGAAYRLKKILLFSKNELKKNGESAKPLQIVEFKYNYSLCPNYPGNSDFISGQNSNDDGKLTLSEIYIYSGDSKDLKTQKLVLEYDMNHNYEFAFSSSDKWGNYMPNTGNIPNHKLPVTIQDEDLVNDYVNAWKLKTVKTPIGKELEFAYEMDSYSHVQDRRAMRLFNIVGVSNDGSLETLRSIPNVNPTIMGQYALNYLRDLQDKKNSHEVVYFKLDQAITASTLLEANNLVRKLYFTDEKNLQIDKILVNLYSDLGNENSGQNNNLYEYVQSVVSLVKLSDGQTKVGVVGADGSSSYEYGYFEIETEPINYENENYEVSSLQLANWLFARQNTPYLVYGSPNYSETDPTKFCDYSIGLDGAVVFDIDINKRINKKEYGLYFNPEKSFARLYEPDNKKFGGNSRIKSIKIKNTNNIVSLGANNEYEWVYLYEDKKSNGVASYEPSTFPADNPFFNLDGYDLNRYRLPDDKKYNFSPVCDLVYPTAFVGYERVETSFSSQIIDKERSIGKNVEYYFTTKSHPLVFEQTSSPTLIDETDETPEGQDAPNKIIGMSQGFVVKTNDFNGKINKLESYNSKDELISSSVYNYYGENEPINYLKSNGSIITNTLPQEVDVYIDSWQNYAQATYYSIGKAVSGGVYINVENPLFFIPYFFTNPLDATINQKEIITGVTLTKIINKSAVVKSIDTYNLGSHNSARNILFDRRSGAVLLSSLKDEFNDELYSFSYPSHWAHHSFLNMSSMEGYIFAPTIDGNYLVVNNNIDFKFTIGDHLKITKSNNQVIDAWVLEAPESEGFKKASIVDENGLLISLSNFQNCTVQVIETGRKNRLTETMMSVTTKRNPIQNDECTLALAGNSDKDLKNILEVGAIAYNDHYNIPCPSVNGVRSESNILNQNNPSLFSPNSTVNPFLYGLKGNFQAVSSHVFNSSRRSTDVNGIRQNGEIEEYVPFYSYRSFQNLNDDRIWYPISRVENPYYSTDPRDPASKWRQLNFVNSFNEQQEVIQLSDQIKVPSAHLQLLNENLEVIQEASAVNAKYNEIGFEGFEYSSNMNPSVDNAFNLNEMLTNAQFSSDEKHTGKKSLMVNNNTKAIFPVKSSTVQCTSDPNIVDNQFYVRPCDCVPNFEQEQGKNYLFSVWVKEKIQSDKYQNTYVKISFFNQGSLLQSFTYQPSGKIIEGWQKIEAEYVIPANATHIQFEFINSSGSTSNDNSYFDDFRTHPFIAAMQTVIYDEKTLLPLAQHDGYNYATFYNYDNNYQLVRVKVESIEGIKTLSEQEVGTYKPQ